MPDTNNKANLNTNRPPMGFRPGFGGPHGPHGRFATEKPKNAKKTLIDIWNYIKREKRGLTVVCLLVTIGTLLGLLGPYLQQVAIDKYLVPKKINGLLLIVIVMLMVYVTNAVINLLQSFLMVDVSQNTVRNLRNDLFKKVETLPIRFFDQRQHGDLMSRFTNDVENINNTINQSLIQLISCILTIIGVTIMMFVINYRLALVCIISIPIVTVITKSISKYTLNSYLEKQKDIGIINGIIEETVTGEKVVKAYGHEKLSIKVFDEANTALNKAGIKAQILTGCMGPMMNCLNNISFALVVGFGSWMTLKGMATIGVIASFINYAKQFSMPLNQLANIYNTIQAALAGGERVFEVMEQESEYKNDGKYDLDVAKGLIEFDNVSFSYNKGEYVLKNVSFTAKPGQTIALVGPTGAGKTTITNLLSRFYDIEEGAIYIDGIDIKKLTKDSLRKRLGIVLQDTNLFSGTVRDNILYGRLDATQEEIVKAATLANADHFIKHLPNGYDTNLTEEGNNLSHGQRQLLSIARTILKDPDILILDEATSSVDTRTEVRIQEAMVNLMKGRTNFIIAHRLSTIRDADVILVINDGRIIEKGSHEELLKKQGFYYDLYNSQFETAV